jgi:hypothetical protein
MMISLSKSSKNKPRNGLKSVALFHLCGVTASKLLKRLVPRVGVEPTRPYGQRILRTLPRVSRSLTKRYESVFTRLAVVKVSLGQATYQHVRPPSWPHLLLLHWSDFTGQNRLASGRPRDPKRKTRIPPTAIALRKSHGL